MAIRRRARQLMPARRGLARARGAITPLLRGATTFPRRLTARKKGTSGPWTIPLNAARGAGQRLIRRNQQGQFTSGRIVQGPIVEGRIRNPNLPMQQNPAAQQAAMQDAAMAQTAAGNTTINVNPPGPTRATPEPASPQRRAPSAVEKTPPRVGERQRRPAQQAPKNQKAPREPLAIAEPEPLRHYLGDEAENPAQIPIMERLQNLPRSRNTTALENLVGNPDPGHTTREIDALVHSPPGEGNVAAYDRITAMQPSPQSLAAYNRLVVMPRMKREMNPIPDGLQNFLEETEIERANGVGSAGRQMQNLMVPGHVAAGLDPSIAHQPPPLPGSTPPEPVYDQTGNQPAEPQRGSGPPPAGPPPESWTVTNAPPPPAFAASQIAQIKNKTKTEAKHKEINVNINMAPGSGLPSMGVPGIINQNAAIAGGGIGSDPDPDKLTPKLALWAKKMKIADNEGVLKSFLVDAAANCAGCPSQFKNMSADEAASATVRELEGANTTLHNYAEKYGINEGKLNLNSRLRLREDGELEIIDVKQPHEAPMGMVKTRSARPDEADYPANAALREIITSDIWRKLTRSEKEAAVAAINDELSKRRQQIDVLARVEIGSNGKEGTCAAGECFCNKAGCNHNRVLQVAGGSAPNERPASSTPQKLMDNLPKHDDNPLDFIEVRPENEYAKPQTPAEERRAKAKVKEKTASTIKPKVAGIAKRVKRQGPWFGPRK